MAKAKQKKPRYVPVHIKEGAWYAVHDFTESICCDCGLVHREEWKFESGRLFFRTFRDERRTKRIRRADGITVVRDTK